MSELVEDIEIKIRLRHCRADPPSSTLGGNEELRVLMFEHYWPKIGAFFAMKGARGGRFSIHGEAIEIIWSDTQLMEVPEESGGDN